MPIVWMGLFGKLLGPKAILYAPPILGALSLVMIYLLGKRVFDRRTGTLAAFWLLLSFLRFHFSRARYPSETVGQFLLLGRLYVFTVHCQARRIAFLVSGIASLTAASVLAWTLSWLCPPCSSSV